MTNDCEMCRLDEQGDQQVILRDRTVIFMQNEKEQGALFDLTSEEIDATCARVRRVNAWMDERYRPDGYNVGWNCGAVGGQIAMHAHLHVIPRFRQEPYAGRGIRYWLKQPANRWW